MARFLDETGLKALWEKVKAYVVGQLKGYATTDALAEVRTVADGAKTTADTANTTATAAQTTANEAKNGLATKADKSALSDYYTKTETDALIGDIAAVVDTINGETV